MSLNQLFEQNSVPWYITPANHKWVGNLTSGLVIVNPFKKLNMSYPLPEGGLESVVIE